MPLDELLALYGLQGDAQNEPAPPQEPAEAVPTMEPVAPPEPTPENVEKPTPLQTLYEPMREEQDASRLLRCKHYRKVFYKLT